MLKGIDVNNFATEEIQSKSYPGFVELSTLDTAATLIQNTFFSWEKLDIKANVNLAGHALKYNNRIYRIISDYRQETGTLTILDLTNSSEHNIVISESLESKAAKLDSEEDSDSYSEYEESEDESDEKENSEGINITIDGDLIDYNQIIQVRNNLSYTSRMRRIDNLKGKILQSILTASNYRYLIQSYSSTLELADGYNKSSVFSVIKDGKEHNNHKIHLLRVAREVIERYNQIHKPSREQILELANLSALDKDSINRDIYNTLIVSLESLKPDNLEITNLDKIYGLSRSLRMLPPGFLSEEHFDAILSALSRISEWLNSQSGDLKSKEIEAKQLAPILKIYSQMIDSLLDNKQLQKMEIANRSIMSLGSGMAYARNVCVSVMLGNWRQRLISTRSSTTKIPSLIIDPKKITTNFSSQFAKIVGGKGLSQGTREKLMLGIARLKNHSNIEVSYLACYIQESIARLSEKGDSNLDQLMKRSMHLILGAKSLGLVVLTSGSSLDEYKSLLKHVMGVLNVRSISKNHWYDQVRSMLPVILEASEDTEKLHFTIDEINSYYKSENKPSWELTYILLNSLMEAADRSKDLSANIATLSLAARIVLDSRYNTDVQKSGIEFLISASSSNIEQIRDLAKKYIKEDIYPVCIRTGESFLYRSRPKLPPELLIRMENIGVAEIKNAIEDTDDVEQNDILNHAKKLAYPIEQRTTGIREQVSLSLKGSMIEESLKNYIPLAGAKSKYSNDKMHYFSLESRVIDFIENADLSGTPTLLLHGSAGAGKSLFARYIERKYWDRYEQGATIPLFISLPSLQDPSCRAIEQALSSYGFSQDEILELKKEKHKDIGKDKTIWISQRAEDGSYIKDKYGKIIGNDQKKVINSPRILVILDGYDEINSKMNIHRAYETYAWKNIKVIVTSRTEYIDNLTTQTLFGQSDSSSFYEEIFIRPFDDLQIKSFISGLLKRWQDTGYEQTQTRLSQLDFEDLILGNKELKDIIEQPFMLEIVMQVLPRLIEKKRRQISSLSNSQSALGKVTRYEIYDLFMQSWFKREGSRIRKKYNSLPIDFSPERSAEAYATAVAAFMFEKDIQVISGNSVNYSIISIGASEGADFFGGDVKDFSREAGPFKKVGEMRYAFIHKSIQEFLVAKGMLEDIRLLYTNYDREVHPSSILNKDHVQKDSSILRFVLDEINPKDIIALERIILSTRNHINTQKDSPISVASANAATIYVRTRYTQVVSSKDWSYTQIMGADLSGAYFYDMDFTGSNWRNVVARSLDMRLSNCESMELSGFNTGEYAPLIGHRDHINVVWANSYTVFSGGEDEKIRLWDIDSGKCLKTLEIVGDVLGLDVFRSTVFSSGLKKNINIWDLESGNYTHTLEGHTEDVLGVVTFDSKAFSASCDNTIRIWDMSDGKCINVLNGHEDYVASLCIIDSKIASGSGDKTIRVWDIVSGDCINIFKGHKDSVTSLYAIGCKLLSGSDDSTVRIWDINSGKNINTLKGHDAGVRSVCASETKIISGSIDETIRIWDLDSGVCLRVLHGHKGAINRLCYNNSKVFSGSWDSSIRIWDLEDNVILGQTLEAGHTSQITSMHINDNYMFSGSRDKTIRIWDIDNGMCLKVMHGHEGDVWALYATDSKLISMGVDDSSDIRIWDIATGDCIKVIEWPDERGVDGVYARGSKFFLGGNDNTIRVWDLDTSSYLQNLNGHEEAISAMYTSGSKLFSSSYDQTIRVWDLDTGDCLLVLQGHNESVISIHSNNSKIVSGSYDFTVRVWDIVSGDCLHVLSKHENRVNVVYAGEHHIFSADYNGVINIWSIDSGECLNTLHTDNDRVLAMHLNNNSLFVGCESGYLMHWDISNIKNITLVKMTGRRKWEQPLKLIKNSANCLYGLSTQNQLLFEHNDFKANVKSSNFKNMISEDSDRDLITQLKIKSDNLEAQNKSLQEQNRALQEEVVSIKDQLILSENNMSSRIDMQKAEFEKQHHITISKIEQQFSQLKSLLNLTPTKTDSIISSNHQVPLGASELSIARPKTDTTPRRKLSKTARVKPDVSNDSKNRASAD